MFHFPEDEVELLLPRCLYLPSLTLILRFLEIEALSGLLRVAPAAMVTSVGSISVLFSFSSSDISASNCDASHCSKYQDGGREALLLERITAGCKRPLDSCCPVRGRTCYFINYL